MGFTTFAIIVGVIIFILVKIKELAEEAKEKTAEYAEQVKGKVTSTVGKGKELFEEKKSLITTAMEAGKEAYAKEKEKLTQGS
jgi:hypothetical protein